MVGEPSRGFAYGAGARFFPHFISPSPYMKQIKLSGRELAVLRSIDYAVGSSGDEIRERTLIESDELAGILNGLCDVGYVEMFPTVNVVTAENYADSKFEINPSYSQQLKEAMRRR